MLVARPDRPVELNCLQLGHELLGLGRRANRCDTTEARVAELPGLVQRTQVDRHHGADLLARGVLAALARRCRCNDRCFKVEGRHTHTEIHASAALECVRDIDGARKVTDHDFGSRGAQRFRTLIVTTNKGAYTIALDPSAAMGIAPESAAPAPAAKPARA